MRNPAVMTVRPPTVVPRTAVGARQVAADYLELTKPRIAVMALVTVAAGYLLGAADTFSPVTLFHTLVGAGLVAAGGSALNHWLERRPDARMHRTRRRPVPDGRVSPAAAFGYGLTLATAGVAYLAVLVPRPGAAVAAAATFALYVLVYTPLKRVSVWNTVVGAVPGGLPPVIGYLAARDGLTAEAVALFSILFVWQLPHFYSIAYLHRDDYARGGMRMLPVVDRADGRWTGVATAATAGLLVPVTAVPFAVGAAGWVYLAGGLALAVWFLARSVRFARVRSNSTARSVLRGSLVYLLGVMALLAADGIGPRYLNF